MKEKAAPDPTHHMPKSLLEQLPEIVANGRKQAEKILEGLEGRQRVRLLTRELVLPARDAAAQDWVTAQKRAERALRDVNERMTMAADSAGLGVWDIDMETGKRIWDVQMYRLFGVSADAPDAEPLVIWRRALHPDDRERTNEALANALAGGRPFETEFRIVHPDGSVHHLRGAAHVVRDAQGRPLRMIGLNHDVTEQRQLEQELRDQNALMRSILDALPCGMSVFNHNLDLVASNTEYKRLLGFPDALFERQPPRFEDFIRYNAERGEYGDGDVETIVADIVERARGEARAHRFERVRPGGIPLEIQGAPMPGGGCRPGRGFFFFLRGSAIRFGDDRHQSPASAIRSSGPKLPTGWRLAFSGRAAAFGVLGFSAMRAASAPIVSRLSPSANMARQAVATTVMMAKCLYMLADTG